jgi:hypothetical protein
MLATRCRVELNSRVTDEINIAGFMVPPKWVDNPEVDFEAEGFALRQEVTPFHVLERANPRVEVNPKPNYPQGP